MVGIELCGRGCRTGFSKQASGRHRACSACGQRGNAAAEDGNVDRLVLGLVRVYPVPYLRVLRRRSKHWRVVADINAALAAAGLATTRRHTVALSGCWRSCCSWSARAAVPLWPPAGSSPGPGGFRCSRSGLRPWAASSGCPLDVPRGPGGQQLANSRPVTRHLLEYLGPTPASDPGEAEAAAGRDQPWPALSSHDVAGVAVTGVSAIKDSELRARLLKRPPAGGIPPDTRAAEMGLTRDARGAGWRA